MEKLKLALRRVVVVTVCTCIESLGQVFRLLYIGCDMAAQWIRSGNQTGQEAKMEQLGSDLADDRAAVVTPSSELEMPILDGRAVVLNPPSESEIQLSEPSPVFHKRRYYAVAVGRRPGIYNTWADANREVSGYSGNCHQAFGTFQEAKNFVIRYRGL